MKNLNLQDFPAQTKNDWISIAKDQLKGENPMEVFKWKIGAVELHPYYDSSDLEEVKYLIAFFENQGPFRWKLYEEIEVKEESQANRDALDALAGGCDGIIFKVSGEVNTPLLLKDIMTDICDVSVIDSGNAEISKDFATLANTFQLSPNGNTYLMNGDLSPVDALVDCIKNFSNQPHLLRHASPDFFLEVASVRALRYLLSDQLHVDGAACTIHSMIPVHEDAEYQWFLNATAGLAAILGGSHSVTFTTATGSSRISRNVGNLIREESGIHEYSGQCNGSYFVEALTHQLVEASKKQLSNE